MTQPEWRAPPALREDVQARLPKLSVYNSLTRTKTPFVPLDPEGRKIGWYVCGPTVYDDSHLGHARNYVSTDIIRRILKDYFAFDVNLVMNITDVDDKIILAARQQYLLSQWYAKHSTVDENMQETTRRAFAAYLKDKLPELPENISPEAYDEAVAKTYGHVLDGKSLANDGSPPGDKEAKVKMHLSTAQPAAEVLQKSQVDPAEYQAKASGVLLPYIDAQEAHTIRGSDHEIFARLTKTYEQHFFDDMASLNVLYPDKLTRVTEYGPQIINFVEQIQKNGFAYEHQGSIYYDTMAWEDKGGVYARLKPWNRNSHELQQDGEGSLSVKKTDFKHSTSDFALWKASKPGEISWPSPWGDGRPGWHIECSAMASDVLGKTFDIHSGGIDLAFPHHDNELVQAEAYWCPESGAQDGVQWVNYFLHMGHLSIQGSKMSKSLKNFTTIREVLARGEWTPRALRIVFLLGAWKDGLEITPDVVRTGQAWEERVSNLFIKVLDLQKRGEDNQSNGADSVNGASDPVLVELEAAKEKFHVALCDSFDTPAAMRAISDLVTVYNSTSTVSLQTSILVVRWITEMVQMFGLDNRESRPDAIGWTGLEISEEAKPFIYPLAALRDRLREQAINGNVDVTTLGSVEEKELVDHGPSQPYANASTQFKQKIAELHASGASPKEYLAACDYVRDEALWALNIYLEDREGQPALVRPLSALLREQRQDRENLAAAKAAAKQKAKADAEAAEAKRLEQGKLSHLDMFRTSEYSAWDADGLPTIDAEGNEVAKSKSKKLRKQWETQKKLHTAYLHASGSRSSD